MAVTSPDRVLSASISGETGEMRDGLHGLASWLLAAVLGAILLAMVGASASRPQATAPASTELTNLSYEIDRLFRSASRPATADLSMERAEAGQYPQDVIAALAQLVEVGKPVPSFDLLCVRAIEAAYSAKARKTNTPIKVMDLHPVPPWNTEATQPQLPRSGPGGQPTESSHCPTPDTLS